MARIVARLTDMIAGCAFTVWRSVSSGPSNSSLVSGRPRAMSTSWKTARAAEELLYSSSPMPTLCVPCPGNRNAVSVPLGGGENRNVKRRLLLDFDLFARHDLAPVVVPARGTHVMRPDLGRAFGAVDKGRDAEELVRCPLSAARARVLLLRYWSAWHCCSVLPRAPVRRALHRVARRAVCGQGVLSSYSGSLFRPTERPLGAAPIGCLAERGRMCRTHGSG